MAKPTYDHLDPDLVIGFDPDKFEFISVALANAVAHGRLFVLSNNGEYQQVESATFWKNDSLLHVSNGGYEFDQDGKVTREWREEADRD